MGSVGVYLPRAVAPDKLVHIAKEIELLGYDSVWLTDHLFDPYGTVMNPFPECWTTLTAIGCVTKRIRLGSLVLNNAFRNPALVAKMSSTLDCICGGRLNLGIGAGWFPEEHQRFGFTLQPPRARIQALSEAIQVILGMWTLPEFSFSGKFYRCAGAVNEPKPLQKPHPPLCIGGKGSRILDLASRYADIYNASGPGEIPTPDEYAGLMDELKVACSRVGRNFGSITKTWGGYVCISREEKQVASLAERWKVDSVRSIVGDVDACVSGMKEFERAGVEGFIVLFPDLWESGSLEMATVFSEEVLGFN